MRITFLIWQLIYVEKIRNYRQPYPNLLIFVKIVPREVHFFVPDAAPKNNNPEVAKTQLLKMKHILNMKVN